MKKILVSATALSFALTASGFAADLPPQKTPVYVPPPLPLWGGFYVGLNAGGTFSTGTGASNWAADLLDDYAPAAAGAAAALSAFTPGVGGSSNSGFIGGGQVGYNFQPYQILILGLEADIQGVGGLSGGGSFIGSAPDPLGNPTQMVAAGQFKGSLDYLGTVRGRAGFLFTPTWLVYGTGGLAYGGANLSATFLSGDLAGVYGPGNGSFSYSNTRVGWTLGGGVEWMFMPNWSAKVEYLYYDLGTVTTNTVVAGLNNTTGKIGYAYGNSTSASFNGHIVRAGVNYHFNWSVPAPVLAKY